MSYYTPTNVGGYNCTVCGMWVPTGVYHACGGTPTYPQPDTVALALGRIEALLQQILRKLETPGG